MSAQEILGLTCCSQGSPSTMGVEGWSCDLTNLMFCLDESAKVTGSVTMLSRFFMVELSNNHKG